MTASRSVASPVRTAGRIAARAFDSASVIGRICPVAYSSFATSEHRQGGMRLMGQKFDVARGSSKGGVRWGGAALDRT